MASTAISQKGTMDDRHHGQVDLATGTMDASYHQQSLNDPPFNPFLKWHNTTTASKMPVWEPADYLKAHKIATKIEAMSISRFQSMKSYIKHNTFKDTHTLQPGEHTIFKEQDRKRVAAAAMFVLGKVTDAVMEPFTSIAPSQNTFDREGQEDKMAKYSSTVQKATLTYLKEAVTKLVEITGGEDAWKDATDAEIEALLAGLFDQHPLTVSKHCFLYENEAADFEKIWAGECANAAEWQEVCRKKFILLTLATYKLRVRKGKSFAEETEKWTEKVTRKDMKKLYEVWDGHMGEGELRELVDGIGGIRELPARVFRCAGSARDDKVSRWFEKGFLAIYEDMGL
nr:hypothetical protein B0A51_14900 [Rachicladosporium sp. CCFEE 5018]